MKIVSKTVVGISLLSVASGVFAADGLYIGVGLGNVSYDATIEDFEFLDDGSITSASLEDSDTGFSILVGKSISPELAIEGGYIDFGELSIDATSSGGPVYAAGPVSLVTEATALFVNAKGKLALDDKSGVFGKIGLLLWDGEATISDSTGSLSLSDDGTDGFVGFGGYYNISNSTTLSLEYTLYSFGFEDEDLDADVLMVGAQFGI